MLLYQGVLAQKVWTGTRTKHKGDGQRHFPKMATWGPGINRRKSVGANCREGENAMAEENNEVQGAPRVPQETPRTQGRWTGWSAPGGSPGM